MSNDRKNRTKAAQSGKLPPRQGRDERAPSSPSGDPSLLVEHEGAGVDAVLPPQMLREPFVTDYSPSVDQDYKLDGVASWLVNQLKESVPQLVQLTGILYIRHAIATTPVPCWAISIGGEEQGSKEQEEQLELIQTHLSANLSNGLMPIVSVIDAFSQNVHATNGMTSPRRISIRLGSKRDNNEHIVQTTRIGDGGATPIQLDCSLELVEKLGENGFATEDTDNIPWSAWLNSTEGDIWVADKLSCGAALAKKIGDAANYRILPHALIVRSLLAGLQEAVTYLGSDLDSRPMYCILEKPKDNLGFAVGLQLWRTDEGGTEISNSELSALITAISRSRELLDRAFIDQENNEGFKEMGGLANYNGTVAGGELQFPAKILDRIAAGVMGQSAEMPVTEWTFEDKRTVHADVQRFLKLGLEFSNETLEGQELQYGLLLGEPFYTRFWPGELPIVMDYSDGDTQKTTLDHLRKAVHLSAGPQNRCLAVGYGAVCTVDAEKSNSDYKPLTHSAYSIDLTAYFGAVASSNILSLRTPLHAVYSMLTYQCPWAVATIVGPGAKQTVFNRGEVIAIRDGKGWYSRTSPIPLLYRDLVNNDKLSDVEAKSLRVLAAALILAEQCSPLVREGAHGGFIVYRPDGCIPNPTAAPSETGKEAGNRSDKITAYPLGEEWKLDKNVNWLRTRKLLKENKLSSQSIIGEFLRGLRESMDSQVAERALRCMRLDGALILKGDRAEVEGYAMQMQVYDEPISNSRQSSPAGTKRLAAKRFVKEAGRGAFAIAVSSDGPVRIWYASSSKGATGTFELFRRES